MVNEKSIVLVDGQAPPRLVPSTRFTLALLVFFAFIVQYSQRVNLPIAIVCMVNRTKPIEAARLFNGAGDLARTIDEELVTSTAAFKSTAVPQQKGGFLEEKQFVWSELWQQILLGAYWAGYTFTQVPGKPVLLERKKHQLCL